MAFPPHLLTCDQALLPFFCIPGLCFCSVKHRGKSLLWMFSVKASRQLSNCRLHNSQSGPICLFIGKQDKAGARNRLLFYDLQSFLLSTAMLYVTVGQWSLFQRSPELELEKERYATRYLPWALRDHKAVTSQVPSAFLLVLVLSWDFKSFSQNCGDTWAVSTVLRTLLHKLFYYSGKALAVGSQQE